MDMKAFSDENVARCTAPNGFNHPLDSWSIRDWLVATMGELGEAANVLKKLNRVRDGIPGNAVKPEILRDMLADELADTYIYIDLTCRSLGLDTPWVKTLRYDRGPTSETMTRAMRALGAACGLAVSPSGLTERRLVDFGRHMSDVVDMLRIVANDHNISLPLAIRNKFDRVSAKIGYVRG